MAALSDRDLRVILGDDYLAKLAAADEASGVSVGVREARLERQNLEEKKFAGFSAMAVGGALLVAGYVTQEPTFPVQAIVAAIIAAAGAAWLFYIRMQLRGLNPD